MKRLGLTVTALTIFGITATGFAYGHGGHGCGHDSRSNPCGQEWTGGLDVGGRTAPGLRHQGRMAQMLGLSTEQLEKLAELRKKYAADFIALREDLVSKRVEAKVLFTDPKTDDGAIAAKEKEINAVQEKLRDNRLQLMLEQRRILTADQLKKLAELRSGFEGMGRGRQCG